MGEKKISDIKFTIKDLSFTLYPKANYKTKLFTSHGVFHDDQYFARVHSKYQLQQVRISGQPFRFPEFFTTLNSHPELKGVILETSNCQGVSSYMSSYILRNLSCENLEHLSIKYDDIPL